MKTFLIFILITMASTVFCQDWPVRKSVADNKARGVSFVTVPAFTFLANRSLREKGTYQTLKLNDSFSRLLIDEQPAAIRISVPLSGNESLVCELVKFELGNIKFTQNNKDAIENVKIPVTYRGIVPGEQGRNNVMVTVNEDYISLMATFTDRVIQVTKANETDKSIYRLYDSRNVQFPAVPFVCGTKNESSSELVNRIQSPGFVNRVDSSQEKCVTVFVDCFDSLYQWRGNSFQQSVDYVYELFNQVATGYINERINIQIITINVWTTADPFRGDTRENALADLGATYKDSFWGNICVGLDFSLNAPGGVGRSGIAADIGRVKGVAPNACPAYTVNDNPFCYNDLNYNVSVQNFPTGPNTTGQQVYLVMHEMGHLLGSRHTKWCGWKLTSNPDTFGALDSCGGMEPINNTTPVCPNGPPPPATGATIMSYCVSGNGPAQFVNFNNGFGPLPGNAIRTFVDQTLCIPKCTECTTSVNGKKNNAFAFVLPALHNSGNTPLQKAYKALKSLSKDNVASFP